VTPVTSSTQRSSSADVKGFRSVAAAPSFRAKIEHVETPEFQAAAHRDDPCVAIDRQKPGDRLDPFLLGHEDVGQHHVRPVLLEELERGASFRRLERFVAAPAQKPRDQDAQRRLVLDDQYESHSPGPTAGPLS
jgi:hypothetical protein